MALLIHPSLAQVVPDNSTVESFSTLRIAVLALGTLGGAGSGGCGSALRGHARRRSRGGTVVGRVRVARVVRSRATYSRVVVTTRSGGSSGRRVADRGVVTRGLDRRHVVASGRVDRARVISGGRGAGA